ncbi:hypothetical protein OH76DRAFT_1476596 [Lentinus brumalis]|uniref:Nucleoporin Nup54 alpha-helical domain-containing protein n=1 Tax=Lentinus brumalis TaxID=2498619 RepID=A0A371DXA5_9APHY|nr:hypothetical protein OH76DRAFT_1476596 [Polyporus brumalis]
MAFNNTTNSMFGGAKPAGSLFGQSTAQPTGSLFGNTQQPQQQQQQPSAFGGFGQPPAQNQGTQGSSLFGSTTQNTGTQGSSLFGSTLGQNNQQQQGQQQQPGGSLFGSTFGQPQQQQQQQQQPTTNIFGQQSGQQQQQQPSSLFGQPQQQQRPLFGTGTGSTSLFGSTTQNQPAQQPGLGSSTFGSNMQPQATQQSLFGSTAGTQAGASMWGRPAAQQQQQFAQPAGAPPFTKSTKFNDLPDDSKRTFESIDSLIQGRIQICNALKQRKLGDEALKGQEEIRNVQKELTGAIAVLRDDVQHTKDLKHKVDQTVQDTIVATRIVEGFRNPQQNGHYLKTHANFPLEFFNRVTEQMRERLRWYKATLEQIERKLSSAASQPQYTPQAIVTTLEAQHATFMALATKAAALDAELQKLRTLYTQLWRAKTGSMRDPFNDLDRGNGVDFGLESLSAK